MISDSLTAAGGQQHRAKPYNQPRSIPKQGLGEGTPIFRTTGGIPVAGLNPSVVGIMGNRRREAFGVRRLAGAFDGDLPTLTTSTPLSSAPWAIEGAKRLECAGLPALSTVISLPPQPQPLCRWHHGQSKARSVWSAPACRRFRR